MPAVEPPIGMRRAGLDDVQAITALTNAAYGKYIPLIGRAPQPMIADYAAMVTAHPVWLLLTGGHLAGVLVLIHEPDSLFIYSVAVRPEYQKQGLGRRLLAWAEQQAAEAGLGTIRLYTNERFEANLRLYRRLGYQETGREPLLGSTVVHMAKTLAAPAGRSMAAGSHTDQDR